MIPWRIGYSRWHKPRWLLNTFPIHLQLSFEWSSTYKSPSGTCALPDTRSYFGCPKQVRTMQLGLSVPAKPALIIPVPLSITRGLFDRKSWQDIRVKFHILSWHVQWFRRLENQDRKRVWENRAIKRSLNSLNCISSCILHHFACAINSKTNDKDSVH